MEYRQLHRDEYPKLAELRWIFKCEELPFLDKSTKDNFIEECQAALLMAPMVDNYIHFGAFDNNDLIAMASLCIINKIPTPDQIIDPIGYLTNVFTLSNYRNRNIGHNLITEVHKYAKSRDLELIIVWPSDESVNFYERLDYQPHGQPLIYKLRDY